MELSKKVGYIKGLIAGLKMDDSTPIGQVLNAMSDLLEEMADEIEINSEIINNITDYIDDIEDQCDCLDDIYAEEYDEDPCGCGCDDEECECAEEGSEAAPEEEKPEDPALSEPVIDSAQQTETAPEPSAEKGTEERAAFTPEPAPQPPQPDPAPAPDPFGRGHMLDNVPYTPPQPEPIRYECSCPLCGRTFGITQAELDKGSANCPGCGELLEFE